MATREDTDIDGSAKVAKYSSDAIVQPKKLRKGQTRWNQFAAVLTRTNPAALDGPMLDFGCGIGYFLREGLQRGMNIWGLDRLPGKLVRYHKLIDYTASPPSWKHRYVIADGVDLPFPTDHFAAVSSWYVFEHIPQPGPVIRELVRATRPGGIIAIRAQDARNGWEGHCKIPWVPFLSGHLALAWIEEFGRSSVLYRDVYDITQPQVIAIFEALGCNIVSKAPPPQALIPDHHQLTTEARVRRKARQIRAAFENGQWRPQPENLYVYAQKH